MLNIHTATSNNNSISYPPAHKLQITLKKCSILYHHRNKQGNNNNLGNNAIISNDTGYPTTPRILPSIYIETGYAWPVTARPRSCAIASAKDTRLHRRFRSSFATRTEYIKLIQ